MIVVVVVDTSPSMGRPAIGDSGLSRLDVAKMAVEDLQRQWRKIRAAHVSSCDHQFANLGQLPGQDQFLLLSTSRQHPDSAACAAGGRLLVGFGSIDRQPQHNQSQQLEGSPQIDPAQLQKQKNAETFQRELKDLKVAKVEAGKPWAEGAGGAVGLNAALSAGLQLLSRYRLLHRQTENFGMGRLPNPALTTPSGSPASCALQPACLILFTDGACLRHPPKQGGGPLQLHYGSHPLREFYQEPFRWDQRIFVQAIGAREGVSSTQYLHPQLRTLCEVTGGSHGVIRGSSDLQYATEALVKQISPPMPKELPLTDPLFLRINSDPSFGHQSTIQTGNGSSFVNGGPICNFQSIENDERTGTPLSFRAMLLYASSSATTTLSEDKVILSPPLYCIPESFFPSKKMDALPPRPAQPRLFFSKYPLNLGSKSFEPLKVIKMLHRLDQMLTLNREATGNAVKLLHRDVYVNEWLDVQAANPSQVHLSSRQEYFPILVPGAGRPSLSDDGENYLNIGILHAPLNSSTLSSKARSSRLATLTLLPPEPHILLPLLLRLADAEHRAIKSNSNKQPDGISAEAKTQAAARAAASLAIDEAWKSELRAYLFRLPPYYQWSLKRCLRPILPSSTHSLLLTEANSVESIAMQCFSKACHQKIRQGEQVAIENNDRLERQETGLRSINLSVDAKRNNEQQAVGYGQYDPRATTDSYLAALRNMPAPVTKNVSKIAPGGEASKTAQAASVKSPRSALEILGDLPAECMMAYYESRRRWLFGGPGLSIRGLHVDGVRNDGSNSHECGMTSKEADECPLSLAGIGVSTLNQTSTTKMGEYRERLLYARSPVVGSGANDTGVSATTAIDGSPIWSVDDDALPMTFFDPKTGDFADSVHARVRSKLQVNFGNPYREKRADSLIPENYLSQAPSTKKGGLGSVVGGPRTPPGSPPQDSFDSVEEGEAIFGRSPPTHQSPKRVDNEEDIDKPPPAKRPRTDSEDTTESAKSRPDSKLLARPLKLTPTPPPRPPNASQQSKPRNANIPAPPRKQKGVVPPPPRPPKKNPPPPKPPHRAIGKGPSPPRPPNSEPNKARKPEPPKFAKAEEQKGPVAKDTMWKPNPDVAETNDSPKLEAHPKTSVQEAHVKFEESHEVKANGTKGNELESDQSISPKLEQKPHVVASASLPPLDLESPNTKPKVQLPEGWIAVWSKSQKRWYFFDTKTNKSVWQWPPPQT